MKYKIRRFKFYKNYVFLLSVVDGNAFWTAHVYEGSHQVTLLYLASFFQKAHDIQVEGLLKQAAENELPEFKEATVEEIMVLPDLKKPDDEIRD